MTTKLLVDGDLYAFRCSASAESDNAHIAAARMETLLDTCLRETNADEFQIFLTGPTNFRYQVYPEYKAQRKDQYRPQYLPHCRDYLLNKYNAILSDNCEADDLMSIAQTAQTADQQTIICTLDKDLLQVPGWHYSWRIEGGPQDKRWVREACLQEIAPLEGARKFYTQMLMGDSSDNVKGVDGLGPKKAAAMLSHCETEEQMFDIVREAYGFDEIMLMNGRVLYMQRVVNDDWKYKFDYWCDVPKLNHED